VKVGGTRIVDGNQYKKRTSSFRKLVLLLFHIPPSIRCRTRVTYLDVNKLQEALMRLLKIGTIRFFIFIIEIREA